MFPTWKLDLALKLTEFILSNNYIYGAGHIWKLGPILPMGCVISGDALDSICLANEVKLFILNMLPVTIYKRFRDDTFVMADHQAPAQSLKIYKL